MVPYLTAEEWQYISVLVAADIRRDRELRLYSLSAKHLGTWAKIQPACEWPNEARGGAQSDE
jgi:hypothetical protein